MIAAPKTPTAGRLVTAALALAALVLPAFSPVRADGPPEDGVFITVPNPITSGAFSQVREQTERARQKRKDRLITKIVYDFNPDGREAASPDFGPCADLADYLRSFHDVTTVAFVHARTTRHTVLPVLACREVVMGGAETRLGEVAADPNEKPTARQAQAYADVVGEARAAVVLKMIYPNLEVLEARKNNAVYFVDRAKVAEAGVVGVKPDPVLPAGRLALLTPEEALRFGLCKLTHKETRQQVAEVYGMSAASLRGDPLQGRVPNAWSVQLSGKVDGALKETIKRRVRKAVRDGANIIIVQLENCGRGDIADARNLADFFRELQSTDPPVMSIAYIPNEAPDTATFIAFGCTEIVMGKNAVLGDFSAIIQGGTSPDVIGASLRELAEKQGIPPLLASGMVDVNIEIHRARSTKGFQVRRPMTAQELDEDGKKAQPEWRDEGKIKHKGQLLKLTADQALELGVVRHVIDDGSGRKGVEAAYNLERVRDASPDWLDSIAEFLRTGWVSLLLVVVGFICLILEFKIPGATAPGVIAAICFVLFFWSQAVNGQIIILAILLFLLGLILIGIEVFILPGFGFVGISGILLILVGLGLATIERMPQSNGEWLEFGSKLTQFGFGLLGAVVGAILVARYLPNIPIANRMVLTPPGEKSDITDDQPALPGVEQSAALLGVVGTAATVLRPAGMARFGEQYVDVVAEGTYIPAGARVQVIEVEGNRIVVKEV